MMTAFGKSKVCSPVCASLRCGACNDAFAFADTWAIAFPAVVWLQAGQASRSRVCELCLVSLPYSCIELVAVLRSDELNLRP